MANKDSMTTQEERERMAKAAMAAPAVFETLINLLEGDSRSKRQRTAATLAIIAEQKPELVAPHAQLVIDSLGHPEAQTRWECLNILGSLLKAGETFTKEVLDAAEDSLFDEKSGIVREAAFRYYCLYGATSEQASDEAWPNLDEAIQCYHGNPEFSDELTHLVVFAEGKISKETAAALTERMKFDSENAKGTLRMRSEQIVKACAAK